MEAIEQETLWEYVRVQAQFFFMGIALGLLVGGLVGFLIGLSVFAVKTLT